MKSEILCFKASLLILINFESSRRDKNFATASWFSCTDKHAVTSSLGSPKMVKRNRRKSPMSESCKFLKIYELMLISLCWKKPLRNHRLDFNLWSTTLMMLCIHCIPTSRTTSFIPARKKWLEKKPSERWNIKYGRGSNELITYQPSCSSQSILRFRDHVYWSSMS